MLAFGVSPNEYLNYFTDVTLLFRNSNRKNSAYSAASVYYAPLGVST